ncbi:hypothetical protein [Enterovirga rhinocerotis]|uniref:Uncharacterized protein n=1 Tax=Enterovirga rhinocerotis TaxID=1339210 RepID=A0A4R7BX30_9HYPH|nr:hypothetical protein [Enterovirga rhinocerotis]TDR90063.1 hypothetical protein EV668_2902 [Enterovirga rhinocerotis]
MPKATLAELQTLLERLTTEQHALIDSAARHGESIHRAELRTIAELENAIAAVLALIDERGTGRPAR